VIDATPFLKFYARRRGRILTGENAPDIQHDQLLKLVRHAANTRYGRDHGFAKIKSLADFQTRVPLHRYEDMWRDYWQPEFPRLTDCSWPGTIPYIALSSGTTSGTTKYIPCSHEMNRANERGALDLLVHHLANRPRSRILAGKTFMLGGSTDLSELAPGIFAGDLSGIAAARVPPWSRPYVYPPRELALIPDWEKKIDALSRGILEEDIRAVAGTPSWLLIFFERLFASRPEREAKLGGFFPDLELIVHGGVNFAPYRPQFEVLMAGTHAETREAYAASEGFIAVQDRGAGEGMRLVCDHGLFYEFVPVEELETQNPVRHWAADIELGVDYAVAVTSCAGLWAYVLGDTVRFVDRAPPRLLVTGRTSYYLSSFGEHLTGEEIERAVGAAASTIGAQIVDFAVGAVFPGGERRRGGHLYIIELNSASLNPPLAKIFLETIDTELSRSNDDYRAHRSGGFGLDPPQLVAVSRGTFEAWMKSRGQLGGQHKVPRIIADQKLFDSLRNFSTRRGAGSG
jgi:GH3 auxin-responsive promoter